MCKVILDDTAYPWSWIELVPIYIPLEKKKGTTKSHHKCVSHYDEAYFEEKLCPRFTFVHVLTAKDQRR